jgi:hypothetical protein
MTNEEFWEWMNTCTSSYAIGSSNVDYITIIFPLLSDEEGDGEVSDD